MPINKGIMSSSLQDWETPQFIVNQFGKFDLDACAYASTAKAPKFFTEEDDALTKKWKGRVWMNPPYGRSLPIWLAYALEQSKQDYCDEVVCLIPARTDTKWFHNYACKGNIRFIKGRIRFKQNGKYKGSPAFPSMIVIFNKTVKPDMQSIIINIKE
jgi:phage N-6-adenine-methyltransferase